MAQFIMLVMATIFIKLLWDVYKEQTQYRKKPRHTQKGGEVIDLSNAWIDLDDMPYNRRDYLLNGKELELYNLLQDAIGDSCVILPRVRLADFISVSPQAKNRLEYANRIKERSADVLICEASNLTPVALVIFETEAESKKKQLADRFTRKICEAVDLPCLNLKSAAPPSLSQLKMILQKSGMNI
ncbi:MAG TPA: DUF2726 domain-containing protein [Gelria sp.]|nr:DUF2726 domain-containing protein [Gelria sp.]